MADEQVYGILENRCLVPIKEGVGESYNGTSGEIFNDYTNNKASGNSSHAEGSYTTASGTASHAEGMQTTSSNVGSHSEGGYTQASGSYSHTEGEYTKATSSCSHAEGVSTTASGQNSHAEGSSTTASGRESHSEGTRTRAEGIGSHAEGTNVTAGGAARDDVAFTTSDTPGLTENITVQGPNAVKHGSHAEGVQTLAFGWAAHSEGIETAATGNGSHAEGCATIAGGTYSHAEGNTAEASGEYSHAEGSNTIASGNYSHAAGYRSEAKANYSHAGGYGTIANIAQYAIGTYNVDTVGGTGTTGSRFIVGKGTYSSARSNAFRVASTGATYGNGAFNTSGADYAEMFEWADGNTNEEDRRGLFVTLDGDKIRVAHSDDDYILGVVSANPAIVGDSFFGDNWHGMYKTDLWGNIILSEQTITNEDGESVTDLFPVLNPEWDSEQEYIARQDRKEWQAVGMIGKLIVVDDGTCTVNGYCAPSDGGIATSSDRGYRVMKRIDDTHVMVLFRHV